VEVRNSTNKFVNLIVACSGPLVIELILDNPMSSVALANHKRAEMEHESSKRAREEGR
jgi:hypothetical protein